MVPSDTCSSELCCWSPLHTWPLTFQYSPAMGDSAEGDAGEGAGMLWQPAGLFTGGESLRGQREGPVAEKMGLFLSASGEVNRDPEKTTNGLLLVLGFSSWSFCFQVALKLPKSL